MYIDDDDYVSVRTCQIAEYTKCAYTELAVSLLLMSLLLFCME